MIEFVAFDYNKQILTYQDGTFVAETPYYYDDYNERYTFQSLLPLLRATAPGAPVYHLPNAAFMPAVERRGSWGKAFVLELAQGRGRYDCDAL